MSNPPPHDPSNPNDPRNWHGHPGPTFTSADAHDIERTPVVYSSFNLLPISLHLLPQSVQTQPQPAIMSLPMDVLDAQLSNFLPGEQVPIGVRSNPLFDKLANNVRAQNPEQRFPPNCGQVLAELRRQTALENFHKRHMQLLSELTAHLYQGGNAFQPFSPHPELNKLLEEIVILMRRSNSAVTSEQILEEIELRNREGLSKNQADHKIHQFQYLRSLIQQQIQRENNGDYDVPEELSENPNYQQLQDLLIGQGRSSTLKAMRYDLEQRIKQAREERAQELRNGITTNSTFTHIPWSQPRNIAPPAAKSQPENIRRSNPPQRLATPAAEVQLEYIPRSKPQRFTTPAVVVASREQTFEPEDTPVPDDTRLPDISGIRDDVLKYNMAPKSAAGLPVGFAFDPAWVDASRSVSANNWALHFYVNDGPQGPQESEGEYKKRITRAVENMGIEHRIVPMLSPEEVTRLKDDKAALTKARRDLKNIISKESTAHVYKLMPTVRLSKYDEGYAQKWIADKTARQTRNAVRRRQAQERLRAEIMAQPETFRMRLPTPPPPGDSGDELYDFTTTQGPRVTTHRESGNKRSPPINYFAKSKKPLPTEEKTAPTCAACHSAKAVCSIPTTGRPCMRCNSNNTECRNRVGEKFWAFVDSTHSGSGKKKRGDGEVGNSKGKGKAKLNSSSSKSFRDRGDRGRSSRAGESSGMRPERQRDERSRSPPGLFKKNAGSDENAWIPCDNCFVTSRDCDNDGPPCMDCILNGVGGSCNSAGKINQRYSAQPVAMEFDPAQLDNFPATGNTGGNVWAGIENILSETAIIPSGTDMNTYQSVPSTAPQDSRSGAEVDELLNFSSNETPNANPFAEMAAQSSNWATREQPVWSEGTQFNAFGQELDMLGNIVPNGRIFNGIVDPDPDQVANSAENGFSSGNAFNLNTETGQGDINTFLNPVQDPGEASYSFLDDLNDTAMGEAFDQPLNPSLPNDNLSLGQDPAQQPEYDIPQVAVLPEIPLEAIKKLPPVEDSAPCDEYAEYFTNWTGAKCLEVPTKSCDHDYHSNHHICTGCHAEQNRNHLDAQSAAIKETKRYMCAPCAEIAIDMFRRNTSVNVEVDRTEKIMLAMCICSQQLRKTWLCRLHHEAAITRVKVRTAKMQDIVTRMSGGATVKCPFCMEREQDPTSGGWGCIVCYKYVIGGSS